jgi:hypothetical protein
MKKLVVLLVFYSFSVSTMAQMKLDTTWYRALVTKAPVITSKELCASKWRTKTGKIQLFAYEDEPASYKEVEEMGYVYTFSPDGTYTVDALMDTDGVWTIDPTTKIVDMHNNVTSLANQHAYMIAEENTLTWYEWTKDGLYITVLEKTNGVYDNE